MTGEYRLVPDDILDRFPKINPSNYGHDDVSALNNWGVEVVLAAASQPEHVKEIANSLASTPVDDKKSGFSDIKPEHLAAHETTTNPVVDHKPENIDHKRYRDSDIAAGRPESVSALGVEAYSLVSSGRPSEPPDELVERAKAAWMKYDRRADYGPSLPFFMAAFAAGYAAEWKARADKLNDYVGLCVPTDEMVGAVAGAISHEREACAKVADMEAIQAIGWNPVFVAHRIAAAIRARKGGGND